MSKRVVTFGVGLLLCGGLYIANAQPSPPSVFVLGVDGMDPDITRRLIAEGEASRNQRDDPYRGLP